MRILAVTNMYPTPQHPTLGVFVEQQVKGLKRIGLDIDVLLVDRASRGVGAYCSLSRRIRASVADVQPDIVHVMYGGVTADITTHAACRRPVVISFCGSDLLGASLSGTVRTLITGCGVLASHRAARKASGIVVKSQNLRDALPADIDASRIRLIPNGIDLDRFRPLDRHTCRHQLGWRADRFHILFSSNAGDPCKRPALAQDAVRALNDLGVPGELHQLSGVRHDEVAIWLNASNALLLTSVTEGSPNIVKEALACDVPVVSLDVGDVAKHIRGIPGCYLAVPEPTDLAAKLRRVHSGVSRIAGRDKMQELSLERVARRVADFYHDLLEAPGM